MIDPNTLEIWEEDALLNKHYSFANYVVSLVAEVRKLRAIALAVDDRGEHSLGDDGCRVCQALYFWKGEE